MLGWELPPYNSGGLGTACLGLTEELAPLGVGIHFVVPKLFGALPYSHMNVLSAADYHGKGADSTGTLTTAQITALAQAGGYGQGLHNNQYSWSESDLGSNNPAIPPHLQANWYARQVKEIAKDTPYSLVHSHDWMTYRAGQVARHVAAARGQQTPFVAHVHSTEIDRSGENGNQEIIALEQEGLHQADRVVAVSHYTKKLLERHYDLPKNKISVVHNGVSLQEPPHFDFPALKKHHKIVLFMGRITRQKGPDYFVRVARKVTEKDPSIRFVLVGSGDMEQRCIEEAARTGLTGKMLFSSFLRGEDVNRAYQMADLFVMPSVSEPFGIAALESVQNGTPVLVSKQSGVAEVSQQLIQIDFWDIDKMAASILYILDHPELREELKNRGKAELSGVSWQQSAQKVRSLYHQLLNPQPLHPQYA